MPILAYPLALLAMTALPAAAAIYLFRNRSRRQPVSSLMFWMDHKVAREGGRKMDKIQTPLLLLLEILALLMLALAASGPRALLWRDKLPVVVVLDDSWSMQAGGPEASPRREAIDAIADDLAGSGRYRIRFIVAGRQPRLLGSEVETPGQVQEILKQWECFSPGADMNKGLALAGELLAGRGRILAVSDQKSDRKLEKGQMQWWAFGRPGANVAFVAAALHEHEGKQRLLLEVANLWKERQSRELKVGFAGGGGAQSLTLDLEPDERRQVVLELPKSQEAVEAKLAGDKLELDDRVLLLPEEPRLVRVRMDVSDEAAARLWAQAIAATGRAVMVTEKPDLVVTDAAPAPPPAPGPVANPMPMNPTDAATTGAAPAAAQPWVVRLIAEPMSQSYLGPFILNRAHLISQGLELQGLTWGAGKSATVEGNPIIAIGSTILLSEVEPANPAHPHELLMRLDMKISTLQDTPNWPILVWNILDWRRNALPGVHQPNVVAGQVAMASLPAEIKSIQLVDGAGRPRKIEVTANPMSFETGAPGLMKLEAGDRTHRLAINAMDGQESDLRISATERQGDWNEQDDLLRDFQSITWSMGLLAAALLIGHLAMVNRSSRAAAP